MVSVWRGAVVTLWVLFSALIPPSSGEITDVIAGDDWYAYSQVDENGTDIKIYNATLDNWSELRFDIRVSQLQRTRPRHEPSPRRLPCIGLDL